MKAILISIKPRFVAKILNGEKTIEIRKTMPKCELPIDVYIYCTKTKYVNYVAHLEGKVVAKFTLNKVEKVMMTYSKGGIRYDNGFGLKEEDDDVYYTLSLKPNDLCNKSCLSEDELVDYLDMEDGYAWFISNLVIFDRPKELGEFTHYKRFDCYNADFDYTEIEYRQIRLTKAPQSWQFIESEEQL